MNRRRVLVGTGVALVTSLAGCQGDGGDGGDGDSADLSINVRIHNEDDESHTFDATVRSAEDEVLTEDEREVDANSTVRIPRAGSPGQTRTYAVAVDGTERTETLTFDVESSSAEVDGYVDVTYTSDGTLQIQFTPAGDGGGV